MNPIDFAGQRSKVKVTMDIYGNKVVNMIDTKPLCISLSYLADMLKMMRGWTLLIFEVRDQKSRSQWTYMEIQTKPLCISLSNLSDMLTMVNPIDLEVTVQKWRSRWVSLTNVGCAGMLRFALLYFEFIIRNCTCMLITGRSYLESLLWCYHVYFVQFQWVWSIYFIKLPTLFNVIQGFVWIMACAIFYPCVMCLIYFCW